MARASSAKATGSWRSGFTHTPADTTPDDHRWPRNSHGLFRSPLCVAEFGFDPTGTPAVITPRQARHRGDCS